MSTKTRVVAHHILGIARLSLIDDIVQVTITIRIFVIDCRRNCTRSKYLAASSGFNGSSGPKQMPCHGLGGTHFQLIGMVAKDLFHCIRFKFIVVGSRCAMGIDVSDGFLFNASILDCIFNTLS